MSIDPIVATTALGLSIVLCVFAWFASRRLIAISLPFAVALASVAVFVPLGRPNPMSPPPGDYKVLGVKIEVNIAIWALLDDGQGEPRYFRLPYTNEAANQLQQALDGQAGGGPGVKVEIDGEGGESYSGDPPVTGEPPKTPETPQISLP